MPVQGHEIGLDGGAYYIAMAVVPMGWSWAVEVIQHIHRGLAIEAGLPPERMMSKRSGLLPAKDLYTLYIDNFDQLKQISRDAVVAGPTVWQQRMVHIYHKYHLARNAEKSEEAHQS